MLKGSTVMHTEGPETMIVDTIMTRHAVSVSMDDNLGKIHNIFATMQFHHLLVTGDDHTLVGIISDRDLLRAISPYVGEDFACAKDLVRLNRKAHQIMSRHPIVVSSGTPVRYAVEVLVGNDLPCLPVVNTWGAAIGIVSWKDILRIVCQKVLDSVPDSA